MTYVDFGDYHSFEITSKRMVKLRKFQKQCFHLLSSYMTSPALQAGFGRSCQRTRHSDCRSAIASSMHNNACCRAAWRALAGPGGPWRVLVGPGGSWRFLVGPGGSWWVLAGPGGSWWVLVGPGGSWRPTTLLGHTGVVQGAALCCGRAGRGALLIA